MDDTKIRKYEILSHTRLIVIYFKLNKWHNFHSRYLLYNIFKTGFIIHKKRP